nr:synaptobrevin, longin-like domain protein [Tanacetum cinerariifolium]
NRDLATSDGGKGTWEGLAKGFGTVPVNDVTRLQALVDKKKVVVTKATIREALRLDDEEGVDCLPNEEIFVKLARMGYKKPSIKLTFYKAFFSSQWKFLIHTILQCMSAKRTSWNEFSSSMASAVICLSSGRQFNFSKYIFDSLGDEEEDADENVKEVNAGDAAKGDDSVAHGEVPTIAEEQSIPSPTPPTPPPPPPPQDIPSTSQLQQIPPQSPQVQPPSPQPQPQPQEAAKFPMNLLQEVMDTCGALTKRVEHLEFDKVAQAIEITKLKRRVKKLERRNMGRMIAEMDQDVYVNLEDDKEEDREVANAIKDVEEAKEDETEPTEGQEVPDAVTTAKLITEVVTAASETVTAASAIITTAEAQVLVATLTAAPARVTVAPSRKRKGVDFGRGSKPLKKKQQIEQDEQYARELHAELNKDIDWDEAINHVKRKAKEDPAIKKYQAIKRKPQTQAQVLALGSQTRMSSV